MEKYRAKVLAVQEVLSSVDRALESANIETESFLSAYFAQEPCAQIEIPDNLGKEKARILLEQLPAAAIVSQFIPAEIRTRITTLTAVCSGFCSFSNNEVIELVAQMLNSNRTVLTGFYTETGRLLESSTRSFSDNLVLEICDIVLSDLPAAAITTGDEEICEASACIAYLAAEVRAQVAWGLVSDWNCFKQDLIAMGIKLYELDIKVGNAITTYADLDLKQLDERTKMLLHQPLQLLKESLK